METKPKLSDKTQELLFFALLAVLIFIIAIFVHLHDVHNVVDDMEFEITILQQQVSNINAEKIQ